MLPHGTGGDGLQGSGPHKEGWGGTSYESGQPSQLRMDESDSVAAGADDMDVDEEAGSSSVMPIRQHHGAHAPSPSTQPSTSRPQQGYTGNETFDQILTRIFGFVEDEGFSEDWNRTTEARGVIVDSKSGASSPVRMIRGQGYIRAPAWKVLNLILDVERRPLWDDLCEHGNVVKRLGEYSDIIYLSYQGKLGVCARDLCLLRAWRVNGDGSCVLVSHSVECDDVPKVAGKVRAELRDCGYLIKPVKPNPDPSPSETLRCHLTRVCVGQTVDGCVLSYVIQLDMKGYVPLFFTNLISTQHPLIVSMMRQLLEEDEQLENAFQQPDSDQPGPPLWVGGPALGSSAESQGPAGSS